MALYDLSSQIEESKCAKVRLQSTPAESKAVTQTLVTKKKWTCYNCDTEVYIFYPPSKYRGSGWIWEGVVLGRSDKRFTWFKVYPRKSVETGWGRISRQELMIVFFLGHISHCRVSKARSYLYIRGSLNKFPRMYNIYVCVCVCTNICYEDH